MNRLLLFTIVMSALLAAQCASAQLREPSPNRGPEVENVPELLAKYCVDCHSESSKEGNLDLTQLLHRDSFDGTLVFENVITQRMPLAMRNNQPLPSVTRSLIGYRQSQFIPTSSLIVG